MSTEEHKRQHLFRNKSSLPATSMLDASSIYILTAVIGTALSCLSLLFLSTPLGEPTVPMAEGCPECTMSRYCFMSSRKKLTPPCWATGARASGVGAMKADAEAQRAVATARDFTMILSGGLELERWVGKVGCREDSRENFGKVRGEF